MIYGKKPMKSTSKVTASKTTKPPVKAAMSIEKKVVPKTKQMMKFESKVVPKIKRSK